MNIRKKIAATALLGVCCISAMAAEETFGWMIFHQTDGSETALSVDGLTMTYSEGVLTVSNSAKSVTLNSDRLESLWFSNTTLGIEATETDGIPTKVEVFSVDGKSFGTFDSVGKAVPMLPKGNVYVIKNHKSTYKILVR